MGLPQPSTLAELIILRYGEPREQVRQILERAIIDVARQELSGYPGSVASPAGRSGNASAPENDARTPADENGDDGG